MFLGAKIAAIELAADEVRVAVVKTGGRRPKILELVSRRANYETPEHRVEAMTAALDDALNELHSRPAAHVLCAASAFSVVRTLTIPFRGRRRVAAAVRFELEPYLAFPIEDLLLDFCIVGEFDGETEVLAMGMRREQVEEQLSILKAAGVDAEAVTLDAVALTGLWRAGRKRQKGLTAVLHVRANNACLAIMHNNALAYFRHLDCPPEQIRQDPAAAAREVQNSIRAFLAKWRGEGQIDALHVTGMDFSPEERHAFSNAVRLPVEDAVMISQLKGGALALADGPHGAKYNMWEAAIGAAVGACGGPYSVDLTKTLWDWQAPLRGVLTHLMFSSCLALLALVGWAFYYYQGAERNRAAVLEIQGQVDALTAEIEAMADTGLGADVDTTMYSDPTLLTLLADIGARMPESKVKIDEIRIQPPDALGFWIRIQGTVTDTAVFNQVINDLKSSALFRIGDDPDMVTQGGTTNFTLKAYRPGEKEHGPETES